MSDQFKRPWRWRIVHGPVVPLSEKGHRDGELPPFSISASPGVR